MTDNPYEILGVSSDSTDEEIKQAYRQLAKKYHPDRYTDSPLAEMAAEKMKEINNAYDCIWNERKKARESGTDYQAYHTANTRFSLIRQLINANRFTEAEGALNACPSEERTAEWYYLKGVILHRQGWLETSYNYFREAHKKDPENPEYKAMLDQMDKQRSGSHKKHSSLNSGRPCINCSKDSCCEGGCEVFAELCCEAFDCFF